MRLFSVFGDHQRRAAIALDHASSGDSDHATVPTFAIHHNTESLAQSRSFFESLIDGFKNAAFFFLTLAVQLVEPVRNLYSPHWIFHAEQLNHVPRNVHASGGIDARRNAEGDFS